MPNVNKRFLILSILNLICVATILSLIYIAPIRELLGSYGFLVLYFILIVLGVFTIVLVRRNEVNKRLAFFLNLSGYSSFLIFPFVMFHNFFESWGGRLSGFVQDIFNLIAVISFFGATIILPILLLVGSIISIWVICKKEIRRN